MSLREYRRKRRFDVTPEPAGKSSQPAQATRRLRYAIQKHQATHLHYDLRLEWNGVLLSWAVPKGPSLDPSVKRLAMRVEDHPLDYADFEGVIPEGEYGAGTVMVWDRGTWIPEDEDVDAALRRGELKFTLHGVKLKGSWVLVRTRSGYPASSGRPAWLLIKHRDAYASDRDVTVAMPLSVISKRTLAEIAQAEGGNVERAASGDPSGRGRRSAGAAAAPRSRKRPGTPAPGRARSR
jgi:bifunctional non-homologous end joining protein LigD